MKLTTPKISGLPSQGLFIGRKPKAVFVRKHNLEANLKVVKEETVGVRTTKANEWLFLVEGHKKYHSVENIFLDDFIEGLDIKTKDPIKPPFTSEISDAASVEKMVAALSILTMDYLDLMEEHEIQKLNDSEAEIIFNQSVDVIAKAFGVSPKTLKKEFLKLKWRNEDALNQQLLVLTKKRRELITESNSQSKTQLSEILNMNRQPNLFIMSGIEHATIFTQ